MCGILALLNTIYYNKLKYKLDQAIKNGSSRGPEYYSSKVLSNLQLHFHRLAINGTDNPSMQPITIHNITLICNGEIYNFKELYKLLNVQPQTNSDCEVIIHLFMKYGIDTTLSLLDGVFAFVLFEQTDKYNNVYCARDPFGVRPLYIMEPTSQLETSPFYPFFFASEIKSLTPFIHDDTHNFTINHFPPGTYSLYKQSVSFNHDSNSMIDSPFLNAAKNISYYSLPDIICKDIIPKEKHWDSIKLNSYCTQTFNKLRHAVQKRVIDTTDRPIACLLSGGLDSSIIAALVQQCYHSPLETYSIGMPGSQDLKYAQIVSKHIGSKHTEIILSKQQFFNAIPEVIYKVESYDTTTIRASVGNYLIGKYISQHSNAKVIFNGDGSDELTGGYIYMLSAPDNVEFDNECKRLLNDIYMFDVLRSDKCIASNGLEARTPFLDKAFVEEYLKIPSYIRNPRSSWNKNAIIWDCIADKYKHNGHIKISNIIKSRPEKLLLRYIIDIYGESMLPLEIIWRTKEAFSDGVSGTGENWYEIINNKATIVINLAAADYIKTSNALKQSTNTLYVNTHEYKENEFLSRIHSFEKNKDYELQYIFGLFKDYYEKHKQISLINPTTPEQIFYQTIFSKYFYPAFDIIPYLWMPKYVNTTDASARTISYYNEN